MTNVEGQNNPITLSPRNILQRVWKPTTTDDTTIVVTFVTVALVLAVGAGIFHGGGKFLQLLQSTEISRGLITFLVALATVGIAIVLVVFAVTGDSSNAQYKERFAQGKEVLGTLVGILGTVLGFYFGSASTGTANNLALAEPQFHGSQLTTYISGGTPPYRYSISAQKQEFPKIEGRVSDNGWVSETLDKLPEAGTAITIDVSDAKNESASQTVNYPSVEQKSSKASKPSNSAK